VNEILSYVFSPLREQEIAEAFFHGFEHKPETTEYLQRRHLLALHPQLQAAQFL